MDWIRTGEAARMLGYTPGHFRAKFEFILQVRRVRGGYRLWLKSEVEQLVMEADATNHPMDMAG